LFDEINVEESKWDTKGRNIIMNLVKKNQDKDYWPRLTSDKAKNPHITADWAKWVDEDEEEEAHKGLSQDWDPSNMNNFNMGNMGNMGGDYGQEGDSDDDEEEEKEEAKQEEGAKKANADLGDLDADAETAAP